MRSGTTRHPGIGSRCPAAYSDSRAHGHAGTHGHAGAHSYSEAYAHAEGNVGSTWKLYTTLWEVDVPSIWRPRPRCEVESGRGRNSVYGRTRVACPIQGSPRG